MLPLRAGVVQAMLKEEATRPVFFKKSLSPTLLENFKPGSNLPLLGKLKSRLLPPHFRGSWKRLIFQSNYFNLASGPGLE